MGSRTVDPYGWPAGSATSAGGRNAERAVPMNGTALQTSDHGQAATLVGVSSFESSIQMAVDLRDVAHRVYESLVVLVV